MTNNVKYYLRPNKVFNKVKRMYKRFVSKYVNKDYIHEFQMLKDHAIKFGLQQNRSKNDLEY